jgi:hypothetical protein
MPKAKAQEGFFSGSKDFQENLDQKNQPAGWIQSKLPPSDPIWVLHY